MSKHPSSTCWLFAQCPVCQLVLFTFETILSQDLPLCSVPGCCQDGVSNPIIQGPGPESTKVSLPLQPIPHQQPTPTVSSLMAAGGLSYPLIQGVARLTNQAINCSFQEAVFSPETAEENGLNLGSPKSTNKTRCGGDTCFPSNQQMG